MKSIPSHPTALTRIGAPTVRERIALETQRTAAHRHMIAHLAVRPRTASARARIHARPIAAGHVTAALAMVQALGAPALADRVAAVAGRARAHRPAADRLLAHGVQAARIALAALAWMRCGREIPTKMHYIWMPNQRNR